MRTMSDREQWAEDHGYSRYRCPSCHRTFWSDSGPHCEYCDTPEPEDPYADEPFEKENEV